MSARAEARAMRHNGSRWDCDIARVLTEWHEADRAGFQATAPNLDHDSYNEKTYMPRKLWICLDEGAKGVNRSGRYMVRIDDGEVFGIKGYGVPHLGHPYGNIATLDGARLGRYARRRTS